MEEQIYRLSLILERLEKDWVEPLEEGAAKAALRKAINNAVETAQQFAE